LTEDRDVITVLALCALAARHNTLEAKDGKPGGHNKPPKGYPKNANEYADPERKAYPIDKKHIHAAITYFGKYAKNYSPEERKRIARRILNAAKKYGVNISDTSTVKKAAQAAAPLQGVAHVLEEIAEDKITPTSALKMLMDYLQFKQQSINEDGDIPPGEL
jgi:hypothetical protein